MKRIELEKIIEVLGGDVLRVIGPIKRTVTHPAPIREARDESAVTFCRKAGFEALDLIRSTKAGVILCPEDVAFDESEFSGKTIIKVRNPRLSFMRLVEAFFSQPKPRGIHPTAVIESDAEIHPEVYIGPFTYVGTKCIIGEGTVIYGHVHIYSNTRIGRNVTIHAGTVIGADGFGYERDENGELEKFPHIGGVLIEDNVEIGANTTIDRGTLGDTIIREGAKIDNLVHIAHNVVVGRNAAVIAHAMVGGSTHIGDYAWIAPSACLRNGVSIGDRAMIGLGALVVSDVPEGTTVMGVPARASEEYKKILKTLKKLVENE
ncbi:UDP-3-O-(3-hydroxymyristoyl)glucosamine N-acyltransferase [Thermus filiformis]|uniref:UDP-3-O-(3-hydroxymyristoyl)glucosamine N-acyltransferase n=1 Tax=Thermus filiformis TaxID=276 RepID=UPI0009E5C3A7|nr:UDP-3-O-(3-hydroxymyristoyl)glucosamine N-acyltransferase [Thermus filiformis]